MSMILNSRVRICCISALLTAFVIVGQVSCCKVPAPDSPRPAKPAIGVRPPTIDRSQLIRPLELRSVSVRKMDKKMAKLAGRNFLEKADDPLVIEVRVAEQIDPTPRASSPVIVLNGKKLIDTRVQGNKLLAFLPDRKLIKDGNTVAVVWLGNERLTLTKHPLTFTAEDIAK